MSVLRKEQRVELLTHLVEGMGIRSASRVCLVDKTTVNKLALDLGEGCLVLHDELMRDLRVALVQVDEQWSFVKKKQKRVKETDDASVVGDQWTYVAEDVAHRAVISFLVGKRTAASARAFVTDLRSRVLGRFQVTADGHKPYVDAFVEVCGDTVDFAQLVKQYECDERESRGMPLGRKRYTGSERQVISGVPDPAMISTNLRRGADEDPHVTRNHARLSRTATSRRSAASSNRDGTRSRAPPGSTTSTASYSTDTAPAGSSTNSTAVGAAPSAASSRRSL